jgi:ABC-type multidrug transport system permease subunit
VTLEIFLRSRSTICSAFLFQAILMIFLASAFGAIFFNMPPFFR